MRRAGSIVGIGAAVGAGIASVVFACSSFSSVGETSAADAAPDAITADADPNAGDSGEGGPHLGIVYLKTFGAAAGSGEEGGVGIFGGAIAAQANGGAVVVGSFSGGEIDLGGTRVTNAGNTDPFLLRLDGKGDGLWSIGLGREDDQYAVATATRSTDAYAGLLYKGAIDLDGNQLVQTGTGLGSAVVRFGATQTSGHHAFTSTAGTFITALAPAAGQGVIAFGQWTNELRVDGIVAKQDANTSGLFLAQLFALSAADTVTVQTFGDTNSKSISRGMGASPTGEVVITGRFVGGISFVAGSSITAGADNDAFVAGFDSTLRAKWARVLGGSGTQEGTVVASVPRTKDFVVAGLMTAELRLPDATTFPATGETDIFVVRFDGSGKVVWAKTFGGAGDDVVTGVGVDDQENVFLAGSFKSKTLDFGGPPLQNADLDAVGTSDIFVAWLDGSGRHIRSARYGGPSQDSAESLSLDASGNVFVAGSFKRTADFEGRSVKARGATDLFVMKLGRW